MKNKFKLVFALLIFLIPIPLMAIDYMYIDDHGIRYYRCDALGASGTPGVKFAGNGKYRITSGFKTGIVQAGSLILAARIACGEIKEMKAPVQKETGKDQ
jgi:hypothetical protein